MIFWNRNITLRLIDNDNLNKGVREMLREKKIKAKIANLSIPFRGSI
jgi:hypothetical protein